MITVGKYNVTKQLKPYLDQLYPFPPPLVYIP